MTERDSLTDWFHALAENPFDALVACASQENVRLLRLHVALSTPEHPLPGTLDPAAFAEAVVALRKSESAWNHATMAALIRARDLFSAGSVTEAAKTLLAFAASCPWVLFKEVALNQAGRYC